MSDILKLLENINNKHDAYMAFCAIEEQLNFFKKELIIWKHETERLKVINNLIECLKNLKNCLVIFPWQDNLLKQVLGEDFPFLSQELLQTEFSEAKKQLSILFERYFNYLKKREQHMVYNSEEEHERHLVAPVLNFTMRQHYNLKIISDEKAAILSRLEDFLKSLKNNETALVLSEESIVNFVEEARFIFKMFKKKSYRNHIAWRKEIETELILYNNDNVFLVSRWKNYFFKYYLPYCKKVGRDQVYGLFRGSDLNYISRFLLSDGVSRGVLKTKTVIPSLASLSSQAAIVQSWERFFFLFDKEEDLSLLFEQHIEQQQEKIKQQQRKNFLTEKEFFERENVFYGFLTVFLLRFFLPLFF